MSDLPRSTLCPSLSLSFTIIVSISGSKAKVSIFSKEYVSGVCTEMLPLRVVQLPMVVNYDTNWGLQEFQIIRNKSVPDNEKMVKFNEHKSEGQHSKQVYDWEILELFFLHHNLDPRFYLDEHGEDKVKVRE